MNPCARLALPHVLTDGDLSAYEQDCQRVHGKSLAVVRPGSARPKWPAQVKACAAAGVQIVPPRAAIPGFP